MLGTEVLLPDSTSQEHHHPVSASRLIRSLLSTEKQDVGVVLVFGVGVGVLSLAVPVGVQTLVNTVTFGSLTQPLLFLVLAVFTGLGLAGILRTWQVLIVEKFQRRFFANVAMEIAYRLPRFEHEAGSSRRFPELVNRFFDVLTVQKSAASLMLDGFALLLQTLIGLLLLTAYHPFLLAFDLLLILAMAIVVFGFGKGALATSVEESIQKYRVAAWLEELAGKTLAFRAPDARTLALERANVLVGEYLSARKAHFGILFRQVVGSLTLQATASAALLGIGAWLVIKQQLTLGQLVAAEIVVTAVLSSLAKFQKHLESFYDLVAALDKIDGLLELPLEIDGGSAIPSSESPAALEVRSLSFSFPSANWGFRNLSLSFEPGQSTALLGSNGSGKTTLMNLLYGLRRPTSGVILVDGIDMRELELGSLRQNATLVRGLEFFSESIAENVRMGRQSVSDDSIRNSLKQLGLMDEVLLLPDGMQTRLGENGSPLSVAQAQMLMIARAIVCRPRLLLVDELIDGLDADSRRQALEVLNAPDSPWTLIISTHSPAIASGCRKTIDLDVIGQGGAP